MSKVIEDPSEVVDDIFDLILSLVQSFLEIGSRAEVSLSAALQDYRAQVRLFVDFLDGRVQLAQQFNRKCVLFLGVVQL